MKTILTCLITLLLALSAVADPELQIVAPYFNFGWCPSNSTVVHHFWFKSVGTDTLIIDPITTGNTLINMPIDNRMLLPGDSVLVPLIFEIMPKAGKQEKTIQVFTNKIPAEPYEIKVEAISVLAPDSMRPVAVSPYRIELAKWSQIDVNRVEFTLTNRSERNFGLTTVSRPIDECEVFVPDSLRAGESAKGYVELKETAASKEFVNSITIVFSDGKHYSKQLSLPIRRKMYN